MDSGSSEGVEHTGESPLQMTKATVRTSVHPDFSRPGS
jgi:hypothetical protein